MMVGGVVKGMSGESAQRAALGAGAIVMDVLASNDGRLYHEKVKRIRHLRPDMILLSGGIDGGTINHVVELSEVLQAANPKPRLGINYKLPVIYAGKEPRLYFTCYQFFIDYLLQISVRCKPKARQKNMASHWLLLCISYCHMYIFDDDSNNIV